MTLPADDAVPEDAPAPPPVVRSGRLHPLSPVVRASRVIVSLAAVAVYNDRGVRSIGRWLVPVVLGIVVASIVAGYLSWAFTRYYIADGDVRVESGVFVRQSRRVRIDRLQAIDVVQPLFGRILGLAELKLDMAGGEHGRVELAYLPLRDAVAMRASLLAMAAGLDHRTPEAPERPLVSCSGKAIVGSALLATPTLLAVVWAAMFVTVGIVTGLPSLATVSLPAVVAIGAGAWRTIQRHFGFVVAESPDGLRLRHGLFETRAQTVPPGRVQAVRIVQPLVWRAFGWVRLDANIAGYAGRRADEGEQHNSVLLPVGSRDEARLVLQRVGVDVDAVRLHAVPRRAWLREPLRWWTLRAGSDGQLFVARSGWLTRSLVAMRHEKVQSVRLSVGPVERALRLARLELHSTHGPVRVVAAARDAIEARSMLDVEAVRAEYGRASAVPERWMRPSGK